MSTVKLSRTCAYSVKIKLHRRDATQTYLKTALNDARTRTVVEMQTAALAHIGSQFSQIRRDLERGIETTLAESQADTHTQLRSLSQTYWLEVAAKICRETKKHVDKAFARIQKQQDFNHPCALASVRLSRLKISITLTKWCSAFSQLTVELRTEGRALATTSTKMQATGIQRRLDARIREASPETYERAAPEARALVVAATE